MSAVGFFKCLTVLHKTQNEMILCSSASEIYKWCLSSHSSLSFFFLLSKIPNNNMKHMPSRDKQNTSDSHRMHKSSGARITTWRDSWEYSRDANILLKSPKHNA
ncbi:hypothetical protein YC2023_122392 [Brassica napus]